MQWGDIVTFATVFMAAVGVLLTLAKLSALIKERKVDPLVSENEWRHGIEAKLERDFAHLEKSDKAIALLIKGQLQVMNHMAYGNHTDDLKDTIAEYQEFLIDSGVE